MTVSTVSIDSAFFLQAFSELAAIGRDPSGQGYQRLAWSEAEREAHRWFRDRAQQLGLTVWSDAAGNSFADLESQEHRPALAIGSHLDTVPYGGAYDGGYGVVGALATAEAIQRSGLKLARPLRICAFTDEEGPRFGTGLLGSKAVAGTLDMELVRRAQDRQGTTLKEAMARFDLDLEDLPSAAQTQPNFWGYIELHIEQGPRLEQRHIRTAAVTAITGIRQVSLHFIGKTNHAGTTPKPDRRNALRAAAETIARFSTWVDGQEELVANPGQITVHPNAANVVPGDVRLDWDVRSPDPIRLNTAVQHLMAVAEDVSRPFHITVESQIFHDVPPCPMHRDWVEAVQTAADRLQFSCDRLVSWAGHDAGVLGRVMPAAMIFIPSRAGVSHAPEEYSTDEAMLDGVQLLAQTAADLLTQEEKS